MIAVKLGTTHEAKVNDGLNLLTILLCLCEEAVVRELLAELVQSHAEVWNSNLLLEEEAAKFVTLHAEGFKLILQDFLSVIELSGRVEAVHRFIRFSGGGVHLTLVHAEHMGALDVVGRFELAEIILADLLALVTSRLDPLSKYRMVLRLKSGLSA